MNKIMQMIGWVFSKFQKRYALEDILSNFKKTATDLNALMVRNDETIGQNYDLINRLEGINLKLAVENRRACKVVENIEKLIEG